MNLNHSSALLKVIDLCVTFSKAEKELPIIMDLSFSLEEKQTLGLVGESGSGKSVTALSLLRLIPAPPLKKMTGRVEFLGQDILALPKKELRTIRGKQIAFIFQEPMTALNPVLTIGDQMVEMIMTHEKVPKKQAWERGIHLLTEVGIAAPRLRMKSYPHELSGGMRQRAMIATALSCNPAILIADEPTTALDVTIQAQILELFKKIMQTRNMAIIFITHDLGVIAEIADRVLVIQNGRAVESGTTVDIFHNPKHPYTKGLLSLLRGNHTQVQGL
jgi:ABC-type dipeptide/oligopeptide/nickel transport system ATPase component